MNPIDETRLETDLACRCQYLAEFMGFGADEIAAIHGAAPLLAPLVPTFVNTLVNTLVNTACDKLLWLQNDLINRHYQDAQVAVAA